MSKKLTKSLTLEMACDPVYTWLPGVRALCMGLNGTAKGKALHAKIQHIQNGSWKPETEELYDHAVWVYRSTCIPFDPENPEKVAAHELAVRKGFEDALKFFRAGDEPSSEQASQKVSRFFKTSALKASIENDKSARLAILDTFGDQAVEAVIDDVLNGTSYCSEEPDWVGEYCINPSRNKEDEGTPKIIAIMKKAVSEYLRKADKLDPVALDKLDAQYEQSGAVLTSIALSVGVDVEKFFAER